MTKEELLQLLQTGENERVEFKKSFDAKTLIAINAMANTTGGWVIVGVADNGLILGVTLTGETLQNWTNEIKQKTEPSVFPRVQQFADQGKNIVVFQVVEVPIKPISLQGRYYIRKSNSNHLLNTGEIVDQRLQSMNLSFDTFDVNAKFNDLNKEAITLFSYKTKETGRFTPSASIENDFIKLGFAKKNKLFRGSELLFGYHHTSIHIGRFKTADTIIDDTIISLPLVLAVEEAMQFIKKNIRLEYEFDGELSRKNKWQFPLPVIRELLLNAIIHKDYRNPTDIIIKIFDNSIVFSNPGGLYGNLTVEDLETDIYQPRHRNRLLAEAFYLMGEVEKYGTGYIRIRSWLHDYPKLEYEVENMGDFTRVYLRQKVVNGDKLGERLGDKLGDKLGDNQKLILEAIQNNPKISLSQLSSLIGISQTAVENNISKLKSFGLLKRTGSSKRGNWEVLL